MQPAPIPADDAERLVALHQLGILDTPAEERFDLITAAAVKRFKVPFSTISLIDRDREWYKSRQGVSAVQGPRSISFCGHALLAQHVFIVEDTLQDSRFVDNPYVAGTPYIRFYIGVTLHDYQTKQPLGVFCIKDIKPRHLTPQDIDDFKELAHQAEEELNAK